MNTIEEQNSSLLRTDKISDFLHLANILISSKYKYYNYGTERERTNEFSGRYASKPY